MFNQKQHLAKEMIAREQSSPALKRKNDKRKELDQMLYDMEFRKIATGESYYEGLL